jgi:hypothetical protein
MKYIELRVAACSFNVAPTAEWDAVDNLLCGPRFAALETVKLRFLFQIFWVHPEDPGSTLPVLLPRVASLGLLQVVDENL